MFSIFLSDVNVSGKIWNLKTLSLNVNENGEGGQNSETIFFHSYGVSLNVWDISRARHLVR